MATIKVKKGDTLSAIAKANNTTVSAIAKSNNIKDVNKISVGQSLNVSGGGSSSSSNKSTSSSSSQKSTSSSSRGSSSSKEQIKATQIALNNKGANLVVDGIMGPKTQAAINKYGMSTGSTSTQKTNTAKQSSPSIPIKQTQGTSYSSVSSKSPIFGNPFAGGFFKNIAGGAKIVSSKLKDALGTVDKKSLGSTALQAKTLDKIVLPDGSTKYLSNPLNPVGIDYSLEGFQAASGGTGSNIPGFVKGVKETTDKVASSISDKFSTKASMASADNSVVTPAVEPSQTSSTMDGLISTEGQGLNPDITGEGNLYPADKTTSKTSTNTLADSALETPVADTSTLMAMESSPSTPTNAVILNNINNLNAGLKDDLNKGGTAWMSSGSKSEFQNTKIVNYTSNVASQFETPEQAIAFYKTPEGIKSLPEGVKAEDIISKVKPVTNGIVGAQTTPEYLTKLGQAPASLAGEKAAYEAQMKSIADYATEYEKQILSSAEKEKQEAIAKQEAIREKTLRDENTVRDRALLAKDELIAKQQEDLAEIEINRVQAKTNLTEFLAKIGALRTDGAAQSGLENLEQKYQALKLKTKNSYDFAIRQNEIDMTDKLNSLDSEMDAKIIDINSDLSKSEREIALDVMKLRFDTKMKGLDYVSKFQDSIKTENEKARAKQEKITSDYNAMLLDLMVDKNIPFDIAKTMINSKGQVNATQANADNIKTFGAKPAETKPAYKGEVLNLGKDTKIATKIMNATGLTTSDIIQLQNELQEGWSLEQIAKNNGMPTSIYNVLRPYVSSPNK